MGSTTAGFRHILCPVDFSPDSRRALRQAGAERIYLAGNPGERREVYVAAGIDEFVFVGSDILDVLRREDGVNLDPRARKGSVWVLSFAGGGLVAAQYVPDVQPLA